MLHLNSTRQRPQTITSNAKSFLFASIFIELCVAHGCSRHDSHDASRLAASAPPAPLVQNEESNYHAPALLAGEAAMLTHDFRLSNRTTHQLRIRDITKACTCTTATIANRLLPPGAETTLTMSVDLHGRHNSFAADCDVIFDRGESRRFRLEATVLEQVEFAPSTLSLGQLAPGIETTASAEVILHTHTHEVPRFNVALNPATANIRYTVGTLSGTDDLGNGLFRHRFPLILRLVPPLGAGTVYVDLVAAQDSQNALPSRLGIHWRTDNSFDLEPMALFFGSISKERKRLVRTIAVRRHYRAPFRVAGVHSSVPSVVCTDPRASSLQCEHTIYVEFNPGVSRGLLYGHGYIEVVDSRQVSLAFPIAAAP
jgi:hypothetical protein